MKEIFDKKTGDLNNQRTQKYKTGITYLESLVENPEFLKGVRYIREKYNIPNTGIKQKYNKDTDGSYYETVSFKTPQGFRNDLNLFAKEYGITDPLDMSLEDFIVHNNFDNEWFYNNNEIIDFKEELSRQRNSTSLFDNAEKWPIAILIDPYMSERSIIDFIKKTYYPSIEPLQLKYRNPEIKIGSVRKRSVSLKEIRAFLYKNRYKPIKELASMLNDKYRRFFEHSYIKKIIKAEKNKLGN